MEDWRARPHTDMDATDDKWLFFFGDPEVDKVDWEA